MEKQFVASVMVITTLVSVQLDIRFVALSILTTLKGKKANGL